MRTSLYPNSILLCIFLLVTPLIGTAQVVFDNVAQGFPEEITSYTLSSFSVSAGTERLLVVHWQGTNNPTSVTFDGAAMDVHLTDKFWYLALGDDNSATVGDVVFSFAANTTGIAAAVSFSGASQAAPLDAIQTQGTVDGVNTNTVNSEANDLVVDFISTFNAGGGCTIPSLTVDGGQTEHINAGISLPTAMFCSRFGISTKAGAASVDMIWTVANTSGGDHHVVNINQNVPAMNVGVGTTTPHPSAMLDVQSTEKGFRMPSMTTEERDAISSPAAGLLIYNTTDSCFNYYSGSAWYKDCGRSLTADTTPLVPHAEGGTGDDEGLGIAIDANGNIYIAGSFEGMASFGGTTLTSAGDKDIFILKYNSSGDIVWAKQAGGTMEDQGYGVAVDDSGNIYVVGWFSDMVTFGGTSLTSAGGIDVFVAKYDSNGNVVWAKKGGGTMSDAGCGIATDPSGEVIITGHFEGSATFGGVNLSSSGDKDIFVVKYDASGTVLWGEKAGGTMEDSGNRIATDGSGNVFINGWFEDMATFDATTLTSGGDKDVFTAKYNGSGTFQWVAQGNGTMEDRGFGIATDASGNSFATGLFKDEITFGGTTLTNTGYVNFFLVKYDASGNVVWAKQSSGISGSYGLGLTTDAQGNVLVSGAYGGAPTFGTVSLTPIGGGDLFVAKYAADGTVQWVKQGGGTAEDIGNDIAVDGSGIAYVTGSFEGMATFGSTSYTSYGGKDFFFAQYNSDGEQNIAAPNLSNSQDNDTDPSNELQNWSNLPGIPAGFSDDVDDVDDTDADPANEYNTSVGLTGTTLNIVDGGGTKSVDLAPIESDPEVGSNTTDYLSKWDGSALVASNLQDISGALLSEGTTGGTPSSGAGVKLMWIPAKKAFRAGEIDDTQWDDANIGDHSFVGGGNSNTASGGETFIGGGFNNNASGFSSFIGGGQFNAASGNRSFVGGGQELMAKSYAEAVFGTYNTDYTPNSTTGIDAADRLFVIGNGTDGGNRSNAMTILKNGNVGIGTSSPDALLDIVGGALLVQGTTGATPTSGPGTRLMWIPEKKAFRAGEVWGTQWDDGNIGFRSFVGGGWDNTASGTSSFVGGENNIASGGFSFVGGGKNNIASGMNSFVGGQNNNASGRSSFVGGGEYNIASGYDSFVGGGTYNEASADVSFVGGGWDNTASGRYSFVGGGIGNNVASRAQATFGELSENLGGDASNWVLTDPLFVIGNGTGGNRSNAVTVLKNGDIGIGTSSPDALLDIVGGALLAQGTTGTTPTSGPGTRLMWIPEKKAFRAGDVTGTQWDDSNIGLKSFVGGGGNNTASGIYTFIANGYENTGSGDYSFIGGGGFNQATGNSSFISGGTVNTASGSHSITGGGQGLYARSFCEAVFGTYNTDYTPNLTTGFDPDDRLFVIGNGTYSTPSNAVTVLKNGNVGIGREPSTNLLEVEGDASKTSAGDWLANSDARLKKNIQPLNSEAILQKMLSLQGITYEWDDDKTGSQRPEGTMYGFTAQNIQEVFPELVEEDNLGYLQTAYGTYDAMYVEAIRAQQKMIDELKAENEKLRSDSDELKSRMAKIEAALMSTSQK